MFAALSDELNGLSGLYLEDCAIKKPNKRALNEEDQDRLWDLTKDLLSDWMSPETKSILK